MPSPFPNVLDFLLGSRFTCSRFRIGAKRKEGAKTGERKREQAPTAPSYRYEEKMEESFALAIHKALHNWRDVEGEVDLLGDGEIVRYWREVRLSSFAIPNSK